MSPLAHPKGKTPSRSCNLRKGVLFSAYGRALLRTTSQSASQTAPLVGEPLAKRRSFPLCQSLPSVGEVALRSNDGEVEPGSGSRSGSPSYNLSVSLRSTAPLVGEPLAKPFTLRGLPKPPLLGATATTAASGGNREELLGPRPAGCERQRSRRWEPQPGQWHCEAMTERLSSSPKGGAFD